MNEVKKPRKPLIYYYTIVLIAIILFNFLAMPLISGARVKEVDYGTFITMTQNKEVGKVEIQAQENQIVFTDKDEKQVYKTGMVDDPDLTQRLYDSGAQFSGEIIEQMSPLLNIFLTWILPILIFVGIGQFMYKKLMEKAGGLTQWLSVWVKAMQRFMLNPQKVLNFPTLPERMRLRKVLLKSLIIFTI